MCDVVIQVDNLRTNRMQGLINKTYDHNVADFKQLSCISSDTSNRIEMRKNQVLEVIKAQECSDPVDNLSTNRMHGSIN